MKSSIQWRFRSVESLVAIIRRELRYPAIGSVDINPGLLPYVRQRLTNEELERIYLVPSEAEIVDDEVISGLLGETLAI